MNKLFITLLSIIALTACTKDISLTDDNLDDDLLGFEKIDTFQLKAYTIKDEPANAKNISNVLLGTIQDSRFGNSKAAFYTQLSLSKNAFDLGENAILDSVVLTLDQVKSYGSLNANFDVSVFELNQEISSSETYNNNVILNVKPSTLGHVSNYKFGTDDGIIKLRLDDSFGNTLLSQFGTSTMESTANFKDFFKGIYVSASSNAGDGMININLNTDDSKLNLYFHSDKYTDTSYSYAITSSEISLNQYTHNTTGSLAIQAATDGNTAEEISYISSLSNFKTVLEIPDLTALNDKIINKAELTIYQADYGSPLSNTFDVPENLFLFQNQNDTSLLLLPDYSKSASTFGGKKELININGQNTNKYSFNITRYIQDMVREKENIYRNLYIADRTNNEGNRIQIAGGTNPDTPIYLKIIYTSTK